jgi:hypothetical protein
MLMMTPLEAASAPVAAATLFGSVGVCVVAQANNVRILYPQIGAGQFFDLKKTPGLAVDLADVEGASIEMVQAPAHGTVRPGESHFQYLSKRGYLGADKVAFVADVGGRQIAVTYFLKVIGEDVEGKNADQLYKKHCPRGEWLL